MIDYMEAVFWGSIGWACMVSYTYFRFSNKAEAKRGGRFSFKSFKKHNDQKWVFGFFGMLVLAAIADMLWEKAFSVMILGVETPYDTRINVILGLVAIPIIKKIFGKAEATN